MSQPFFEADLPPGELDRILQRIEDNLAFRQILSEDNNSLPGFQAPSLAELEGRLQQLQAMQAPLFRPQERSGLAALMRQLLNVPLRLLGYKQKQFNDELIITLTKLVHLLQQVTLEQQQVLDQYRQELARLSGQAQDE